MIRPLLVVICEWCATDFWRYGTLTNERRRCRNGLPRNVHRLWHLRHMRITRWRRTIIFSDIIRMIWYIGMRNERTIISSVLDMSAVSTQESTRCLHDVRSGIIVGGFHDTRIWPIFLFSLFVRDHQRLADVVFAHHCDRCNFVAFWVCLICP